MHGLINLALQGFVQDTYGPEIWAEVRSVAGLEFDEFEAMLHYDDALTSRTVEATSYVLQKDDTSLLEDVGTYLVSHPNTQAVRRLLRYGGSTFYEFLHSLDDLSGRARLAVPDLDMPEFSLVQTDTQTFVLECRWLLKGMGSVTLGALRAMADDYGVLVFLNGDTIGDQVERIFINVLDRNFTLGRRFDLGEQVL
ncbi:MAG: hypothetical protein ACI8TF_001354 [Paracoccaceae bacterium]|jgi:hypothetical protein